MKESLIILFVAFILDLYLGDPVYRFHPVRLIGHLINASEQFLEKRSFLNRPGGLILWVWVLGICCAIYLLLASFIGFYSFFFIIFIVYSSISLRDLEKHGKVVQKALEKQDLIQARISVQMLIGRDANQLDIHGVGRAAVESLAENFVDGFLAPLFWYALGVIVAAKLGMDAALVGGLLILLYRTSNTLDSMVGYKNDRYREFGWFSAKVDDWFNWLPARLGIPIISLAALLCRLDSIQAWKIGWRDRLKHTSPNAGHAEATVAGALHIRLNGPGIYPHGMVDKPWLGDGTDEVTVDHLKKSSYLILVAAFLTVALFALLIEFVLG